MAEAERQHHQKTSRYDLLLKLIKMTMKRSCSSLNVQKIVEETYGGDSTVYGGPEMLVGIVENMLDKLESTVHERMTQHLKDNLIKERLERIEVIIQQAEGEYQQEQQNEQDDHDSAHQALNQALLPPDVTLEDVLIHAAYQEQLEQKKKLTQALQDVQEEIAALERGNEEAEQQILANKESLQQMAQVLEQSADVCSTVPMA